MGGPRVCTCVGLRALRVYVCVCECVCVGGGCVCVGELCVCVRGLVCSVCGGGGGGVRTGR